VVCPLDWRTVEVCLWLWRQHDLTVRKLSLEEFKREVVDYLAASGRDGGYRGVHTHARLSFIVMSSRCVLAAAQPPSSIAQTEVADRSAASINVRVARLALANKLQGEWPKLEGLLRQADVVGAGKVRVLFAAL
jgi:hypothetical protein